MQLDMFLVVLWLMGGCVVISKVNRDMGYIDRDRSDKHTHTYIYTYKHLAKWHWLRKSRAWTRKAVGRGPVRHRATYKWPYMSIYVFICGRTWCIRPREMSYVSCTRQLWGLVVATSLWLVRTTLTFLSLIIYELLNIMKTKGRSFCLTWLSILTWCLHIYGDWCG